MLQVLAPFYSNLSGLILLPLLGSLIILVIPNSRVRLIQGITIWTSLITFLYSLSFRIRFENDTAKFQFVETIRWLPYPNINFYIGIDGIPLFFVILTTFLTPICILVGFYSVESYKKEYMIAFFIRESFPIAVFRPLDLLIFYVFFESVLIPMFIIIGVWGSRQRKIKAAYQFFLYTLMGSLLCATLVLVSLRTTIK
jgi:NADH-ubiquinone oxidoreductase chain 4